MPFVLSSMFVHHLIPHKHQRIPPVFAAYTSSFSHICCLIIKTIMDRSIFRYLNEEMDSCDSDASVEQKKVNVLHRYDLILNTVNLFQLIEFFIAGALISWSSSRLISVLSITGDNLLTFSSNLLNQRTVFLVGNVIIVVCYVLSRRNDEGAGDASIGESVTPSPDVTEETAGEGKPNGEGRQILAGVKTESESAMEVAIKQAVKEIERFRRTQSEKLKREMSVKGHRKLQRSATVTVGRCRLLVASDDGRSTAMSSETVEKLSDEEFQLAVESFISKQQSFLKQEGMRK